MRFILVVAACLGVCFAAPSVHKVQSLPDDINDFIALLPVEDIKAILDAHLETDGAVSAVVEYLQGDAWRQLVDEVLAKPAAQKFIKYLEDNGVPASDIIAAIREAIAALKPGVEPDETGSLRPVLDEVEAILPVADLIALLNDKLQNSPDFQALYVEVSSEEAHALVDEVLVMPEAVNIQNRLKTAGVKVDEVLTILYAFLGWGQPPVPPKSSVKSLPDDINDFIALLPVEDIKAILDAHLETDGAVSAVVEYLQGDAWRQLVDEVLAKPAAQKFIKYLEDNGIPASDIIAAIREAIAALKPGVEPDETGSLRPVLDEVEAILPVADLIALLNDKLQNSPDFQALYVEVSSEEAHALVDEVLVMPEAVNIQNRLKTAGVKVDEVLTILYAFLGWGQPPVPPKSSLKTLPDDINDFIALLPVEDIKAILDAHLQSDGAVSAVVEYLQGDAWRQLVDEVLAKPAAQDFVTYLESKGVPATAIIAAIREAIAALKPGVEPDETGSLRPVLDEVEAILPVADLIALLNDKLQNSPDFQDLYVTISSDKGHALVDEVLVMPEAVNIQNRLKTAGVKVDEVLTILYAFLGWGQPPVPPKSSLKSLPDDINDFIALLPLEDIKAILDAHLQTDGAVSAVVEYLQGDAWRQLVDEVLAKPAAQDFVTYLESKGVPATAIIAAIREAIAALKPGVEPDETGSLRPVLDEVEAILPVADLIALLNDKLQNSPDFQDLYVTISSDKGHALVDEVLVMPEAVNIQNRLKTAGVKVDEVLTILYAFLGWGQPPVPPKSSLKSLPDDINDFIALLPLEDIKAILDSHLQTDGAVSAVVEYLQGDAWRQLVDEVLAKPAAQDFIKYLEDNGVPASDIIAAIREAIAALQPGVEPDETGSLRPVLDEVEAILPVADLIALLNDKLQNSPDFQALYVEVSSEKAHALVDEVLVMPEAVNIQNRLKTAGVKVDEVLTILYAFLGWGQPPVPPTAFRASRI